MIDMSIFDQERKRLGLPTLRESSSVSEFIKKERQRILNGERTRREEIKSRDVDNARFAARAQMDDSKYYQTEKKSDNKTNKKTNSKKSTLQKVGDFLTSKDVDNDGERDGLLGLVDRYVVPISKGATDTFIPGNTELMAQNNPDNPVVKAAQIDRGLETDVLNTVGMIGAMAAPYSQGYKAANVALNKVGALNKITNPYARRAITGATAGGLTEAGISATNELANSEAYDLGSHLFRTGLGVAGGAILDPALYGLGRAAVKGVDVGLKKLIPGELPAFSGTASKETVGQLIPSVKNSTNLPKAQTNPLNLDPAFNVQRNHNPSQPLNEFLGRQSGQESPLMSMAKKVNYTSRELPDFSTAKPTISKGNDDIISRHFGVEVPKEIMDSPPQYWQKRYEDFVTHVNKSYDTNQLTKESLDDLWTQFARYDEPVTLDQVVDLAYTGFKPNKLINTADVWTQMGNRPPVSQSAKKIIGMDNTVGRSLKQPTGQKETPITRVEESVSNIPQNMDNPTATNSVITNGQSINPLGYVEVSDGSKLSSQNFNVNGTQESLLMNQGNTPQQRNNIPKQQGERSFYSNVSRSEKTSPELLQQINEFEKTYTPMKNEELVDFANKYISKNEERAYQFVKNARKFDPRHITVGHRLIDNFQTKGQYDRALDVVERLAEQGTKAGQSIQAFSIYGKLTAEGQLLRAQRRVNQINEHIINPKNKVHITEKNVKAITHAADSIQKLTGQEDLSKNVISLMDKAKKGTKLTDDELVTISSFVSDAKKFIGDLTPKSERVKPNQVKDVRTRDKVVDFMSKKEELARERLKQRMNRANSLPVDIFYDLSVIGASKIAKGTIKFADFAESMAKEFGEEIRPYMQQIYDKAAETFNLQSQNLTGKRISQVEKIVNKSVKEKNLTPEQADDIQRYLRDYLRLTGDAKTEASMELQAALQLLERPTFARQISTAQTIAQLLNPKTIIRNAIGNELFYRVEQINKFVATPIDMAKSKLTGSNRTVTFRTNNQGQYWRNWLTGAKAGWRGVNPAGLNTAYDLGPQAFRSKWNPMTYLEKTLGATLRSFDYAGYKRAYNKTIGELATLKVVNEGLKGKEAKEAIKRYISEADENMMQIADQYGKYATFQDHTVLSNVLTKVKKGANRFSTLGMTNEFGLGDLILKYPKTPGNLIMRALEYSPVGVVRSAYLLKDLKKVKSFENERSFYLSLTRAITGTGGFSLLGYVLADKGILTSSGSSDYEVRNLEKLAGKQANSVNVSALQRFIASGFSLDHTQTNEGDMFISYDWAQPVSMSMALGTGVSQSVKEEEELDTGKAIKSGLDSASNTIVEQSVLRGLSDFLATYPGRTWSDRIIDSGKNLFSSFVPTFSNQIKQINDNTARTSYSPSVIEEMKNRSINRIPGLASDLPPSYDSLGNKRQTYQGGSNNMFNVFFNPSFVSRYKPSQEAKYVLDFLNETGEKTVAPRSAKKYLTIDGEKVELTGDQYSEMQRILGEETRVGLEEVVPKLQGENDFEKIKSELEKVLNNAGKKARKIMKQQVGE